MQKKGLVQMDNKKIIIKETLEWIYCIIIAIALALLIRYFIGTPTIVKQSSMYPTLKENQLLLLQEYKKGLLQRMFI